MPAATQIWTGTFCTDFDRLPQTVQRALEGKVDTMGLRLATFSHVRLQGRREYKLRVGDYRVLYDFDQAKNEIILLLVGNRREIYKRSGG